MSGMGEEAFPAQTAWTVVLDARNPASPTRRARLERLAGAYWRPVCAHLRGSWGLSAEDAADLTQEFFLRFLEDDFLKDAAPERGRFRTFLKMKLRDLVIDDLRRRSAQKRGGRETFVNIDAATAVEPPSKDLRPEEAFDRAWASCLMAEAIKALEAQTEAVVYQAFRLCVLSKPPTSYRDCAEALKIKESDVRNFVFRGRTLLREAVRKLVRESVAREDEVEEEMAYLLGLFGA